MKHCSINLYKTDTSKSNEVAQKVIKKIYKQRIKQIKHAQIPKTINSINNRVQTAVHPPTYTNPQTSEYKYSRIGSRKLSKPTISNRNSYIPLSKYLKVSLLSSKNTKDNLRNLKTQESLNNFDNDEPVRTPIHVPNKVRDYTNTLTYGSLRKHNLRHNRSISNESLVGSIMKAKNISISNISSSVN